MKLILLGPPGSGKGTISEKLIKDFHLIHISAGAILREEVEKDTTLGKEIKKYIDKGILVPDHLVVDIVKLEVHDTKNFILDGFPRTAQQAQDIADLKIDTVIYLDISQEAVIERFADRRVCPQGHSFNSTSLKPKQDGICDYDKLKLIRRKDDDPKIIKERFRVYNKETAPLIEYYRKQGILQTVNADQEPEKVYKEVRNVLKPNRKP